ncbi:MAG: CPBP family intramembrane metalloprotease [Bacteroidetes bacterium]|nr:MAG: CPBP family intramembrane metalloprotease [Bacteroidota bacterium]NOG56225.1 CPBP family intramembrane metalloprotease [Bacteroidota bacterium]
MTKLPINHSLKLIPLESKSSKILSLVVLCLLSGGIFSLIGTGLASLFFHIPFEEMSNVFQNMEDANNVAVLKFLQFFNTLGLFIIPGIIFSYFNYTNRQEELKINRIGKLNDYSLIILLFILLIPIVNYTVKLNELIVLPDFLKSLEDWMKNSEENAKQLTTVFLTMTSIPQLLFNLFLIAVLPAIGEELIFRGILQQTINQNLKNYHIGIWISAALFSAIHFQFYGFFPRILLGAFFGYLLAWSGNLWLPIFAHFINNATGVLTAYFMGSETIESELDQIGTQEGSEYFTLIALLLFAVLFNQFKKAQKNPAQGGISF